MKKQFLLMITSVFIISTAYGGGIVTNSNQSAYWLRTLVRDGAIGNDGVFYNPAGLTKLEDGFHFSLNSLTIFQSKDVENDYTFLRPNPKKFYGDIKVPVFPAFYATWKKNKIAISFGFNPIGGGGGATFDNGLPSLELPVSDMIPTINALGGPLGISATSYRSDVYFKGTSVYFGYQLGLTYQITDVISAYLGARYVSAKNTYEGYLRNVEAYVNGSWVGVSEELGNISDSYSGLAAQANAGAAGATNISGTMGALMNAGLPPGITLAQAEAGSYITAEQRAQIEGGLTALGINSSQGIGDIQAECDNTAEYLSVQSAQASGASSLAGNASSLTNSLFNQEAEVTQRGNGFAPIIGLNFAFDKLNIGLKYEFKTRIELENDTKSDFIIGMNGTTPITMFPDGAKVDGDLPAMMSVGVDYKISPKLTASGGIHYYWDKSASYGKTINNQEVKNKDIIDNNYLELGLGVEYGITEKLYASIGYLLAKTGVSKEYQNDLSFSLTSNTIGGGFGYKLSDKFMVNLGACYSIYNKQEKTYTHPEKATGASYEITDTYFKDTLILGIGIDVNL